MMSKPISASEGFVGGRKYDEDKPRFDLIPPAAEAALARVLTIGARKYAAHGWRTVPAARERYLASLRRHLNAHQRGETLDPESGESHLAHVLCNAAFLYELEQEAASE